MSPLDKKQISFGSLKDILWYIEAIVVVKHTSASNINTTFGLNLFKGTKIHWAQEFKNIFDKSNTQMKHSSLSPLCQDEQ